MYNHQRPHIETKQLVSFIFLNKILIYTNSQFGLPRWHSDKESACQCRRHRRSPWVGNIPWNRKSQPTPEFLPGESHRQRSLVGYQGVSKSWTQLRDSTQTPASLTIFLYLRQYLKLCLYSTPIEQWLHMKLLLPLLWVCGRQVVSIHSVIWYTKYWHQSGRINSYLG